MEVLPRVTLTLRLTVPSHVRAAFVPPSRQQIVPDVITPQMAEQDRRFLARLNHLLSVENTEHHLAERPQLHQHMQLRFCSPGMNILNLLKKGSLTQRTQATIQTAHQHQAFRALLQVRLQRYIVECRSIGDANSKATIERLKTQSIIDLQPKHIVACSSSCPW